MLPTGLRWFAPATYRRLQPALARWGALLDIAGGTLMLILLGLLLLQRAWVVAALWSLLALPNARALWKGFGTLLRGAHKDTP